MNGRERILAHLQGKPLDRLPLMPITMMLAADRIGASYRDYVSDYRVLVEGQLRTAEDFAFDFVSTISDPMREAADCGATIEFFDDHPPAMRESEALLADPTDLSLLEQPDPLGKGRMHDRVRAIELFKERLAGELLIEGWIEGPCAEGADLRGINTLMLDFYDHPAFVRELFAFAVEMELRFARAQIEAGADLIGIGDAAASLIGPQLYEEFVWPYEKQLVDEIHALGALVRLHICGNVTAILGGIARLGCDIIDLDYPVSMAEGREKLGKKQVILGNLDPVRILERSSAEEVTRAVSECHALAGDRFIVGAGCEVTRNTPEENLRALCEYARNHRPEISIGLDI